MNSITIKNWIADNKALVIDTCVMIIIMFLLVGTLICLIASTDVAKDQERYEGINYVPSKQEEAQIEAERAEHIQDMKDVAAFFLFRRVIVIKTKVSK